MKAIIAFLQSSVDLSESPRNVNNTADALKWEAHPPSRIHKPGAVAGRKTMNR